MDRNIIELLDLLKGVLLKYKNFRDGLCFIIDEMHAKGIINSNEGTILFKYVSSQKPVFIPTPEDIFELEIMFSVISLENGSWGWYPGLKEPRLKWIDERIEIEKCKK